MNILFIFSLFIFSFYFTHASVTETIESESTILTGASNNFRLGASVANFNDTIFVIGEPGNSNGRVRIVTINTDGTLNSDLTPLVVSDSNTNWGQGVAVVDDSDNGISEIIVTSNQNFYRILLDSSLGEISRRQYAIDPLPLNSPARLAVGAGAPGDLGNDGLLNYYIAIPTESSNLMNRLHQIRTFSDLSIQDQQISPITSFPPVSTNWGESIVGIRYNGQSSIAVGAPNAGINNNGAVYIYGITESGTITFETVIDNSVLPTPLQNNSRFGISLAVDDLNRDGITDLIVGSSGPDNIGELWFIFLNGTTSTTIIQQIQILGSALTNLSFSNGDLFTSGVALGDWNLDTIPDLMAGASGTSTNAGSVVTLTLSFCGDQLETGSENCEDGNIVTMDGCSDVCQTEIGYDCTPSMISPIFIPSDCSEVCGDSIIIGNESCDDGNNQTGDGCSANGMNLCVIEPGFSCNNSFPPSFCMAGCGDGMIVGTEVCDDGNMNNGDGCSAACAVEIGFNCTGTGNLTSICNSICGDGLVVGTETCDDENLNSGDGCSSNCMLESGYTCVGTICFTTCGDGIVVAATEECDVLGNTSTPGCTNCMVNVGFTCESQPSVCNPICGDGIIVGNEECDDGNTVDGDGCNQSCFLEDNSSSTAVIIGVVVGIGLLCCILVGIFLFIGVYLTKKPAISEEQAKRVELLISNDVPILENIQIGAVIGSGEFGEVYKGNWQGTSVALKGLKGENIDEFANELSICSKLRHPHVLNFLGIFVHEEDNYMVLEFMDRGDLLTFLHKEGEIQIEQLNDICVQIANGMAHLHSNNIIHRDLACRNILLSGKKGTSVTAKVADFGLSRIIEDFYLSESRKIPVRWTAPEAIETLKFDKKCDVWSYGIVVWEIFSRGQVPYPGMSNDEILKKIPEGYRLPPPLEATVTVAEVMNKCWDKNPDQRLDFEEISQLLKDQKFEANQIKPTWIPNQSLQESSLNLDTYRPISNLIGPSSTSSQNYSQTQLLLPNPILEKKENDEKIKKTENEINRLQQQITHLEKYYNQYKEQKKEIEKLQKENNSMKKRLGDTVGDSSDSD